ncbi:cobalt-precorrin-6A reductase [Pseudonocardia hydrocarbonoxydans]|uniref:Precorrin-6A reductase n=1 Tax=Pseudonocardia hydrocarbonoxydans TaxID=76726 RepID=A0A4Y3WS70_9PSEU|nr:cobalt-precorrin-6A reductase [Pseudonocardia hydrocarbonoxydans]GEC21717.1 precorrin-6A reductase [Pseudonocardia hydrocarbonoxydans]
MDGDRNVLVLGGTAEARRLAAALVDEPGVHVVSSLAGRVRAPARPPGEVRIGGFGGPDALAGWLAGRGTVAVVDATHPFAARMSAHAAAATAAAGVPLLVLRRPGWTPGPGDDWTPAASLDAAADLLPGLGERAFLTTGRGGLAAFAASDRWFLVRSVDPPEPPAPRRMHVVLGRGPFTVEGERALLRAHAIDVLVTKDSGGPAAKLTAARELGVPVLMVTRPPVPPGVEVVETVAAALERVRDTVARCAPSTSSASVRATRNT